MKYMFAFLFFVSVTVYGKDKGDMSFNLSNIKASEAIMMFYADALKTPYVLAPEVLSDSRMISFRFSGNESKVRVEFNSLLNSLGYSSVTRSGIEFVTVSKEVQVQNEVFVYRPKFREVNYLTELLKTLFKGSFTVTRSIPSVAAKTDMPAAPGSATSLIDRNADTLIFNGEAQEIERLKKLLSQVDFQVGEVMVRGVVYEVQTGDSSGSAFALASQILNSHLSISIAGPTLENSVKFSAGSSDAIFSALSKDSRFKVVTQPSLRVKSGSQARFSVGQDVPVLGSVSYSQSGAPIQSIEYRSSGVIFDLSPVIRESSLELTIDQQLSNFVQTSTGVNGSPTLIKRQLKTSIQASDGEVIVLGGLTEEKNDNANTGLPFLPDFMKSKVKNTSKTELILVLQVNKI